MIWGEVINSIRKLHLDLIQEFSIAPKLYTADIELPAGLISFPEPVDDFDEWEEFPLPQELQDLVPLHPVERALIEGPLLPIQLVRFRSRREIENLFSAISALEKSWLEKSGVGSPDKVQFIETFCSVQALKTAVRAGFRPLHPAKEEKS
jgi:hypothetical protein